MRALHAREKSSPPVHERSADGLVRCSVLCCAGELISGRDDARAKRKQLIKQVEKVIETVESQIKRFDKSKGKP